jgi:two-component system, OmpR family, sensor histidine kinase RstB
VETLVRSRDELVQAVSHELGSPLARLRFHLELLENQPEGKRSERLEAMARELDALEELVAELLNYAQSDHLKLDQKAFEPHQVLSDLAELAHLEAPDDHTVHVELSVSPGAIVLADPRLFQRAVENLLRNAVQHARSRVCLELRQDETHVHVAVHDDGPGIPKELHEKVTVAFFRLQADRDRKTGGAGLGLAIVNRIMQRHGGRIAISASPLGGAMVATIWPRPEPR